jgi:lysozyme family protein
MESEQDRFARSLPVVLRWEGGFVDHPRDPGGATNLGVTLKTAQAHRLDLDGDGDTDVADLRRLTAKEAAPVYRAAYWLAAGCDRLPAGLDLMVFDAAVNQGPSRARRFAAEATEGPVWRRIEAVRRLREGHYRSLSTFPVFGRGWLRRLTAVAETARRLAETEAGS